MRKMKKNREKMYRSRWTKIVSYILVTVMTVSLFGQIAANGTFDGTGKQAGTGTIAEISQVEAASDTAIDYKMILEETSVAIKKKLTTYKVEVADETGGTSIVDWYGPANASIGGEWAVIGECRYGMKNAPWYRAYYNNLMDILKKTAEAMQESAGGSTTGTTTGGNEKIVPLKLDSRKSTENSRAILALTSMGLDASDIEGYDLTGALSDMTYVKKQGINGPIFALIALDSGNYEIKPLASGTAKTQVTREKLVTYILNNELKDGGFCLSGTSPDPDVTAMALQALAPYYKGSTDVSEQVRGQVTEAVNRGIRVLSEIQNEDGTYSSWGTKNAESTAQVLVALSSLGLDGDTDVRFIKNGHSVLDGLKQFYLTGKGAFEHVASDGGNQMATEQAFYALVSYDRYKNNKNTLYNMTDAVDARVMDLADCQVKIPRTTYTYAGKAITPAVTVSMTGIDGISKELTAGTDYTVTYKNNTKPGKATVQISGTGMYKGMVSKTVSVYTAKASVKSVTNTKKGLTVTWKKVTGADKYILYRKAGSGAYKKYKTVSGAKTSYVDTGAKNGTTYSYKVCAYTAGLQGKNANTKAACRVTAVTAKAAKAGKRKLSVSWKKNSKASGYQIRYSLKSSFSGAKTVMVRSGKTTTKKLTGLKRRKRYYITVRAYKTVKGKKYYSSWSKKIRYGVD